MEQREDQLTALILTTADNKYLSKQLKAERCLCQQKELAIGAMILGACPPYYSEDFE